MDGLKRQRKIFVRAPEEKEKNANKALIDMGGIPVDKNGEIVNASVYADQYNISEQSIGDTIASSLFE
jgi:hypothetical protein